MESNSDEDRSQVEARIKDRIKFHNDGGRCTCGNEIWVVGSAAARWAACFSHIIDEVNPDDDLEIIFSPKYSTDPYLAQNQHMFVKNAISIVKSDGIQE